MSLPVMDQETRALVQFGFFRGVDLVMLGIGSLYSITLLYWWVFTWPSAVQLMTAFFGLIILLGIWIVLLLFRACRFIVEIRAAMAMLPVDSAKALASFLTSGGEAGESVGLTK